MHEIKNLTNSPYDIETADGSVRLPAMGSVEGEFTDEQLTLLRGSGLYEVVEVKAKAEPRQDPFDHDGDGRKGGSKKGSRSKSKS